MAVSLPLAAQVSFDRLRQSDAEPGNWLTYSGNYSAHRYSGLDQITAANVQHLRPAWVYQIKPRSAWRRRHWWPMASCT